MSERSARVAGESLLHPVTIGALALWIVNDHVWKHAYPGVVTGKLSDIASLVVAPLLLLSLVETFRPARSARSYRRLLWSALLGVGGLMISIKLFEPAAWLYCQGLGLAQWPFAALHSLLSAQALPPPRAVALAMDPSDLFTLPSLLVAAYVGLRTGPAACGAAATHAVPR